jgi:3',5'-cyclic-AMP phosphodiesterase
MSITRILQLTDLHVFSEPNVRLKGVPTRELLQDVVRHILSHESRFDHVVITGDHTHDEQPGSYEAVRSILAPFADRLRQLPGNHDDRTILRTAFPARIGGSGAERINFQFCCGDWMCLGLDSQDPGKVPGLFDNEQANWLTSQLDESDKPAVALFIHHPPVDVGSQWMDAIGLVGRESLQSIIKSDPRIQCVFCGHVHHEFESSLHQARVFTTPATGLQFSPDGATPTFAAKPPGYRVIELSGWHFKSHVVRLPETRYRPDAD